MQHKLENVFFASKQGFFGKMASKTNMKSLKYLLLSKSVQKYNLELVSKELNHLAAILHAYTRGLSFMK